VKRKNKKMEKKWEKKRKRNGKEPKLLSRAKIFVHAE